MVHRESSRCPGPLPLMSALRSGLPLAVEALNYRTRRRSLLGAVAMITQGLATAGTRAWCFGAVVPSWLLMHTYWTFHYAFLYCRGIEAGPRRLRSHGCGGRLRTRWHRARRRGLQGGDAAGLQRHAAGLRHDVGQRRREQPDRNDKHAERHESGLRGNAGASSLMSCMGYGGIMGH